MFRSMRFTTEKHGTAQSDEFSSDSRQTSSSRSSDGRTSPATSDDGSSSAPHDSIGSGNGDRLENEVRPPDHGVALTMVPESKIKGYILFGVQGSCRLHSARTRLAQIDVAEHKHDDSFFDELRLQYRKLRGECRWIFSIWGFGSCEFTKVKPGVYLIRLMPIDNHIVPESTFE